MDLPGLTLKFVRSSGPGGQSVNKTSSACELRLALDDAASSWAWLPKGAVDRIRENEKSRINANGEMIIASQQDRSQHRNRELALQKLEEILLESWDEPPERKPVDMRPTDFTKDQWKQQKRVRAKIKESRAKIRYDES